MRHRARPHVKRASRPTARGRDRSGTAGDPTGRGSAPVEHLVAEVLEPEGGVVGAALGDLADAGLDDFAHEDRVVALLDGGYQAALDEGRGAGEDRRAGAAGAERLAGDRRALALGRLAEREG